MSGNAEVPVAALAFITTIHVALLVLRTHRSPSAGVFSFVTPVSLMFAASPWMLPTQAGVAIGLAAHAAWFIACEQLLPVATASTAPAAVGRAASTRSVAPAPSTRVVAPSTRAASAAPPRSAAPVAGPGGRPRDFVQLPVIGVCDETHDIRTFRLQRPDGFDFKAGQFLTIRLRADGQEHVRCYSISSRPDARGYLEITVKRLGSVSSTLHATVRPGSMLAVRPPSGAFVYPSGDDRPLVFIAGGVGITPLMSMVRHGVDLEPTRPLALVYSVRAGRDIAFHDEIRMLDRRHSHFHPVIAVTDEVGSGAGMFPGRINPEFLALAAPDIVHSTCMVCGPPAMIDDVKRMLVGMGVPATQIHFEIFQPALAASAGTPVREQSPGEAASTYEIRFERSGRMARIRAGQTLLDAAEACDADVPSLCRAGVCGTCRTRVVSGDSDCASQTLDARDRADGFVLPCVTRPHSDCVIEA